MKLGIMQPYFFPYIGYFQLINAVDTFVIYDNVQFSKKGWMHRNRMLLNGSDTLFSLTLKKDSDFLDIRERRLSDSFQDESAKLLRRIKGVYCKAPYFDNVMPIIENCLNYPDRNLFEFLRHSILLIIDYLGINKLILTSSEVEKTNGLKNKDRVLSLCKDLNAEDYINPIGGIELYNKEEFLNEGINLFFIKRGDISYKQFDHSFVSDLSILDVMMFNNVDKIKVQLDSYSLI